MNVPKYRVFVKAGLHAIYSNAWSSKDEMFYEVANIDYYEKEITVWGCGFEDCGACDDSYKFEDVNIMSYIGLKDNNGRDIYEGDIIKVFYDNEDVGVFEIRYFASEGYPAFDTYPSLSVEENSLSLIFGSDRYKCEVIGNIYLENNEVEE